MLFSFTFEIKKGIIYNRKWHMKDEVTLLGVIKDEKYGVLAHFFSNNKGNYFARIIEKEDMIIYDELSLLERQTILNKIAKGEYYED